MDLGGAEVDLDDVRRSWAEEYGRALGGATLRAYFGFVENGIDTG